MKKGHSFSMKWREARIAIHAGFQKGLTLVELLVTMVLLSLILSLMATAMGQISQVLRITNELDAGFLPMWRRSQVFKELIENLVLDPKQENAFIGTEQSANFQSFSSVTGLPGVAQAVKLELIEARDRSTTALEISGHTESLPLEKASMARYELGQFPQRLALKYLDSQGSEYSQWPVQGKARPETLPSAVLIKERFGQQALVMAAVYAGPVKPPNAGLAQILGGK